MYYTRLGSVITNVMGDLTTPKNKISDEIMCTNLPNQMRHFWVQEQDILLAKKMCRKLEQ
jgi:hypothetical protein